MTWEIVITQSYLKRARRFLRQNPQVKAQYAKVLELLALNPRHPSLRLHRLKGNLKNLHSVSINMQHRITIELIIDAHQITLINIGVHNTVY